MSQAEREYIAFISYRHKERDMAVAKRVHALIEKYRVPAPLRKNGEKRLGIAFRDQEELPVSQDLSADIRRALDHSAFLIVVCTPDTPASPWVNREIDYFLKNHSRSRVLAILASGDPECSFPRALTHTSDEDARVEPLAANICAENVKKTLRLLKKESVRLFAAMLDCPYDSLVRREQKRRQRRRAAALLAAFAILVGYAGILLRSNLLIENKNRELEQLNQSLREQKRDLQRNESIYLTRDAQAAADDPVQAIEYALAALPKPGDDRPYYAPAESALISALGVYKQTAAFVHPRRQEITLNAPGRVLQATEDGKNVIVLDEYDGISSYDASDGSLNWQVALSTVRSSQFMMFRGSTMMTLDPDNGLLYALFGNELFAIQTSTGSIVWQTGFTYSLDQFTKIGAGNILVCLQKRVTESFYEWDIDAVALDALTGREIQRCSFGRPFKEAAFYNSERRTDTLRQNTAFSEDGKRFCGVIYETENGGTCVRYYVYDLEKNEVRIAYSEPEDSYDEILWMGLSGGEEKNCLTVIKQVFSKDRWLNVRKIDLAAGALLHEEEAKPEKDPDVNLWTKCYAALMWRDDLLLASAGDQLYLIRLSTGEVVRQTAMKARVLSLYKIDEYFFGFVLSDGTYEAAWLTNDGFRSSKMLGATFDLGAASAACTGKSGFMKPVTEESRVKGFLLGSRAEGFGYVVLLDQEDQRKVRIVRLVVIEKLVEDRALSLEEDAMRSVAANATDGLPLLLNPDGTILYAWYTSDEASAGSYLYTWQLFDPQADTPLAAHSLSGKYSLCAWPTRDGQALILHDASGNVARYDFTSGQTEELGAGREKSVGQGTMFGESVNFVAFETQAESVRRPDGTVLTAYCDGESLRLWTDGAPLDSVSLQPALKKWSVKHSLSIDFVLKTGGNGCILLSDYGQDDGDYAIEKFALYDTNEKTWISAEDAAHGDSGRAFAMGEEQACFAVYEMDGVIHLYRLPGSVQAIKTGVASDAVGDFRFLCGDRYLAVCSKEGALEIYDAENAARVFTGNIDATLTCDRISGTMDTENGRLFVIEHRNHRCLCLDAASWTELVEIPYVYGYDPEENRLFLFDPLSGVMTQRPALTLSELMALGQRILEN